VALLLWIHIVGGGAALLTGFVALSCAKGFRRHRVLGRAFVHAMLTMGVSGAVIAALTGVDTSVVVGTLATYLVVTGLVALAKPAPHDRTIGVISAAIAFALALAFVSLGRQALANPDSAIEGLPAPMAFVFAAMMAVAGMSDLRVWTSAPPRRRQALVRHLWRMCVALFIAAASFFLGQADILPRSLRHPALLAIPVLAPLVVMAMWMWRTRPVRIPSGSATYTSRRSPGSMTRGPAASELEDVALN
jgi:uncharacterized membrane protein